MSKTVPLGQTVITANAKDRLNPEDVILSLRRHATCDWGDLLCHEDSAANDQALIEGNRLLSAYEDRNGTKLWIITEWDRSATTVLLPEDY